jgi:hypothetical protein
MKKRKQRETKEAYHKRLDKEKKASVLTMKLFWNDGTYRTTPEVEPSSNSVLLKILNRKRLNTGRLRHKFSLSCTTITKF